MHHIVGICACAEIPMTSCSPEVSTHAGHSSLGMHFWHSHHQVILAPSLFQDEKTQQTQERKGKGEAEKGGGEGKGEREGRRERL